MLRTASGNLISVAHELGVPRQGLSAELRTRISELSDGATQLGRRCGATADDVGELAGLGTVILRGVSPALQAGKPPIDLREQLEPLVDGVRQVQVGLANEVEAAQLFRTVVSDATRLLTTEATELSNRLAVMERNRATAQREYDDIASRVNTMRTITAFFPPAALVDELISLIESGKLTLDRLRQASSTLSAQRQRMADVQQTLAGSGAITHGLEDAIPVIQNLANALAVVAGSLERDAAWLEIGQDVTKARVYVSTLQKSLDWLALQAA